MHAWKRANPDAKPDMQEWREHLHAECMREKAARLSACERNENYPIAPRELNKNHCLLSQYSCGSTGIQEA